MEGLIFDIIGKAGETAGIVGILVPLVWYLLRNNEKNITSITNEINRGFKEVANHVGKTKLTDSQIVDVARNKVWFASEAKLAFIRQRLEKNNLKEREVMVKKHIRTELETRSSEYVVYLNQYSTKIGLVGDFINNNFPMDIFLEEIYDIVFKEKPKGKTDRECVNRKIDDIRYLMLSYQNTMFEEMRKGLNK